MPTGDIVGKPPLHGLTRDDGRAHCAAEGDSVNTENRAAFYFSFTNSNTKIAQIPTVIGNCTNEASRSKPPLGRKNVAASIARAVNIPRINLFQFMLFVPLAVSDFENGSDCTLLFAPAQNGSVAQTVTLVLAVAVLRVLSRRSAAQAFAPNALNPRKKRRRKFSGAMKWRATREMRSSEKSYGLARS